MFLVIEMGWEREDQIVTERLKLNGRWLKDYLMQLYPISICAVATVGRAAGGASEAGRFTGPEVYSLSVISRVLPLLGPFYPHY